MISVGVIGSGAMGAGIAQVAATAGHQVIIYDNNQTALGKAKSNLSSSLSKLVEKQKLSEAYAKDIIDRTSFVNDLTQFKSCSLVIEAIIEDIEIKQKLFSQLESIVSDDCILATNTSSLSIASIASACKKSERVIGIHFFNPAPLMPLVEIIPGLLTAQNIIDSSKEIIASWGKVTVLTKDTPGFIVNRVARSFYGEAIRIYEEGMADFATIDWAMKTFGGFKMGPFELMDFIGNDINYKVTESVWIQFFYEQRFKPSLTQKRLYEAKLFGRKTGRGYYHYVNGQIDPSQVLSISERDKPGFEKLGKYIFDRIISMLINEAIDSYYLKLASKEDLDLAMTKGVNYPKGLLKWADEIGLNTIYTSLDVLYELYNEDRYRPSILLKMMARDGKKFYE